MTETATYSVSLVTQGNHRFYTLTMPSDVLAKTSTVDTRASSPIDGFQRKLDTRRADEIAEYIDNGVGTIPTSIVLSAQPEAELVYKRDRRSITFKVTPKSFLILDGQHRVYGFAKAKASLRVPVVIYNNLTRAQECRLFIDINTKQRPVPNELLLDIKRLADAETNDESLLRDIFDKFSTEPGSPLLGMMSASVRASGKLSRVTFNAALRSVEDTLASTDADEAYPVLAAYLQAWMEQLNSWNCSDRITNPVVFRAIVLLFPDVAQRVEDRHGKKFSAANFRNLMEPLFRKLSATAVKNSGNSHVTLHESFQKKLRQQFTIAKA
jgi:DGQHR domain-containing protein